MRKEDYKKTNKEKQRGSALVFSMIILVNAVIIVGSIVFISAVQKDTSSKVRHTSTALQAADSGIEHVLRIVNQEDRESDPVSILCDQFFSSTGKCEADEVTDSSKDKLTMYFFDEDDNLITGLGHEIQEIAYVHAVGEAGYGEDRVSRSFKSAVGEKFTCGLDLIKDDDGNEYKTIEIASDCWMAQNLNLDTAGKKCYNHNSDNCDNYGGLYPWSKATGGKEGAQGLCPEGWHIPTDKDWYDLESELAEGACGENRANFSCWPAGEDLLSNLVGDFNAKLGGYYDGSFKDLNSQGYYWTSSPSGTNAYYRQLKDDNKKVGRYRFPKRNALSVRCVRDE
ncbi:MAG: FISUMP domain-containing protein [Patescibacteria group bacterium]